MVALLTSVRNSPCFGGLRRTKTCHWQLFARPSSCFLVLFAEAKRIKPFPFGNFPLHGKHVPVGAARYACFYSLAGSFRGFPAAYGGYPCCFRNNRLPLRGISRGVGAPPLPVHAKRVCCLLRKQTKKKQKPRFLGFCFFGSMIFLIRLLRSFSPCQILLQFPQTALP